MRLPNNKFRITDKQRSIFEDDIAAAEKSNTAAKEHFDCLLEKFCSNISPEGMWEKFETEFLEPLVREIGANAYNFIAGKEMKVNDTLVHQCQSHFPEIHKTSLSDLISQFLDPANNAVRSYISRLLHATFCVAAIGLPDTVIAKLNESIERQIQFRILVDTNFLFSILSLHNNPFNATAIELKELINSLNQNLKIDLYITPRTIDEAKHSISITKSQLFDFPTSSNFSKAISQANFSGLAAKFLESSSKESGGMSPDQWFGPYLNNFVLVAEANGVKLFNDKLENYATRQDVIDDIHFVLEEENRREGKKKGFEQIQHDVILWHFVNDKRSTYSAYLESPIDAQDWVLTLDFRFINFDKYKQRNQNPKVPICVHPTTLIQLLQFWVPKTEEFEKAILGSMRLPFLLHELDAEAEHTSARILKSIGRYQGSATIPEETIARVMLDEGLRARLVPDIDNETATGLIRDTLIEEMQNKVNRADQRAKEIYGKFKTQTRQEKDKHKIIEKLLQELATTKEEVSISDTKIQDQDNKIQDQDNKIQEITSRFERLKIIGMYLLFSIVTITISVIGGWVISKFYQPFNAPWGSTISQILASIIIFLIVIFILEMFLKWKNLTIESWPFQKLKWLRVRLFSLVGLVLIELVISYINNHLL